MMYIKVSNLQPHTILLPVSKGLIFHIFKTLTGLNPEFRNHKKQKNDIKTTQKQTRSREYAERCERESRRVATEIERDRVAIEIESDRVA